MESVEDDSRRRDAPVSEKRKLKPVLDGDWWLIGPSPDLRGLLCGAEEHLRKWEAGGKEEEHNAPVDHNAFRDPQGIWHLWGCVRATAVVRILYHWRAESLTDSPWEDTREMIRCDRDAGECLNDRESEQIQSPFFVEHEGLYYMFYGGTSAGVRDDEGRLVDPADLEPGDPLLERHTQGQICLMTSEDGRNWTRHRDERSYSRLFVGPGPDRDPCVIRIGDRWHIYYVGFEGDPRETHGFTLRTSEDLIHWSEPKLVHRDLSFGRRGWRCECPFVAYRGGYYYLFRTVDYYSAETYVFRSEDPTDFGVGDARDKLVCRFPGAAVEIYATEDGTEYVSSNHNPPLGTQMCRLRWEPDE